MLFYIRISKPPKPPDPRRPNPQTVNTLEQNARLRHHRAAVSHMRQKAQEAHALERRFIS
jgi:hypothetical protein